MCLIAKYIRYHLLNFIAMDLQLYKIFKIHESDFFGTHCVPYKSHYNGSKVLCAVLLYSN